MVRTRSRRAQGGDGWRRASCPPAVFAKGPAAAQRLNRGVRCGGPACAENNSYAKLGLIRHGACLRPSPLAAFSRSRALPEASAAPGPSFKLGAAEEGGLAVALAS
jgi:hypothetical protein